MLLLFSGGRKRTEHEFDELLRAASFWLARVQVRRGVMHAIEEWPSDRYATW